MRGSAKDLDERGREWTPPVVRHMNADAFTRNGERHCDAETAGGRDAVAAGIERLDLDFYDLSTGERSAAVDLPADLSRRSARGAKAGTRRALVIQV